MYRLARALRNCESGAAVPSVSRAWASGLHSRLVRDRADIGWAAGHEGDGDDGGGQPEVEWQLSQIRDTHPHADYLLRLRGKERKESLYTIANASGASLTGSQLAHLEASFLDRRYPSLEPLERMYPFGVLEDKQMAILRRSNISMPCKRNQRVYGEVFAVNKHRVWVDVGHSQLAMLNRKELNIQDLVRMEQPVSSRSSSHDVRRGDVFLFRLAELKCPLGGVWLEPHRRPASSQTDRIWAELEAHQLQRTVVRGRILNELPGGYAVGIAGFVGMLAFRDSNPDRVGSLGQLQPFRVLNSDRARLAFTVRHADVPPPDAYRGALQRRARRM